MKINFETPLKALDETVIQTEKNGEKTPFLLKTACIESLMTELPQENQSGEQKLKRALLAKRIFDGTEIEITPEESALLKERIGKAYSALIVYAAYGILNG